MPRRVNWRRFAIQRTASTVCSVADCETLASSGAEGRLWVESTRTAPSPHAPCANNRTTIPLPFVRSRLITTISFHRAALKARAIGRAYWGVERIAKRRNRDLAAPQGFHIAIRSIADYL